VTGGYAQTAAITFVFINLYNFSEHWFYPLSLFYRQIQELTGNVACCPAATATIRSQRVMLFSRMLNGLLRVKNKVF
jgi:hypothetical protein